MGGLVSGSLALLADAGHMATDAAGLGLALIAAVLAQRPATEVRTFGLARMEILAAVVNAAVLFALAGYILVEAGRRLTDSPEIGTGLMLVVALVGLAANAVSLWVLRHGQRTSLNVRGAYLEVLGDLLGSAAVVVAAVVIALTGFERADAVASVLVAVMILPRTWGLLREAVDVLLEATPRNVDLAAVRAHILAVPGVIGVHDLHAWTITSGLPVLSAHVVVDDATANGEQGQVLDRLGECLADHFDVEHCTFQVEPVRHRDHEPVLHR
ncbi:cation efflux protein [Candidatus Protofrankia californiensis]|uniref:Cation efflux protein n=1 Tax=Candidatus Protofrankia californiensis TaxID=1839754 RepID=A0A1C3P8V2_9ACTN|nr:cation efflux protein [Candidatus Protofrankia californiensis]